MSSDPDPVVPPEPPRGIRGWLAARWPHTGLWRHRDFMALWAGQAVSALGSRITRTAVPVIAVLAVGGSAFELGLLAALGVAPGALVGLFLGGTIDRSRKRPLLIGADLARAALVLSIPIMAWLDALSMPLLYVVTAAVGMASSLFQITDNTYLPVLIDADDLPEGNAKLEATESVAEIVGPGLAGVLIDLITAPVTMVVDAVSYVLSAMFLNAIRAPEEVAGAAPETDDRADSETSRIQRWRADLRQGWRACMDRPVVRALFWVNAGQTFVFGFFFALYMLFTLDTLGLSPGAVGAIISVGGLGGLAGALLARRLGAAFGRDRTLFITALCAQAGLLLLPAAGGAGMFTVPLLVAQQLIGDAFLVAFMVHAVSARQNELPLELLGRGNALFQTARSALLPTGAVLAGAVAEYLGVHTTLWLGVGSGMLVPLLLWPALRARGRGGTTPGEHTPTAAHDPVES